MLLQAIRDGFERYSWFVLSRSVASVCPRGEGLCAVQLLGAGLKVFLVDPAPRSEDIDDPLWRTKLECVPEEVQLLLRVFKLGLPSKLIARHPTHFLHLRSHIPTAGFQTRDEIDDLLIDLIRPIKILVLQGNVRDHSKRLDLCRRIPFEAEFADKIEDDFGVFVSFVVA